MLNKLIFIIMVSIAIFLDENGVDRPRSMIYDAAFVGFRYIDIIFLGLLYSLLLRYLIVFSKNKIKKLNLSTIDKGILFWYLVIFLGICVGLINNGEQFFFSWRGFFLGTILFIFIKGSFRIKDIPWLFHTFSILVSIKSLEIMFNYITGHGVTTLSLGYIPVFDGAVLDILVFSALGLLGYLLINKDINITVKIIYSLILINEILIIILSFRRGIWVTFIIGLLIVLFFTEKQVRYRFCFAIFSLIILIFVTINILNLGSISGKNLDDFLFRIQSINVFNNNQYSQTNEGHLDDIIEGFNALKEKSLIFGLGVGVSYKTNLTSDWKDESWGVHNGIIDNWQKFGLIGLFCYFSFYYRIGIIFKSIPKLNPKNFTFAIGFIAFIFARFIVSLTFINYTLGSVQENIILFLGIGILSLIYSSSTECSANNYKKENNGLKRYNLGLLD